MVTFKEEEGGVVWSSCVHKGGGIYFMFSALTGSYYVNMKLIFFKVKKKKRKKKHKQSKNTWR